MNIYTFKFNKKDAEYLRKRKLASKLKEINETSTSDEVGRFISNIMIQEIEKQFNL